MLALLLLLAGTDPAELLRDLSAPDIEVRQAAAAELHRRGGELREVLVDARRDAQDVEVRSRLDDLLRRLDLEERIRGFGGGNRVSEFGLALRSDRWYGSGRFRLTVELMNLAPSAQGFPGFGALDVEGPEVDTKCHGAGARLTVRKVFGGTGLRRTRWGASAGGEELPLRLGSGESTRFDYVLDAKDLAAGDYELRVEYFAAARIPGAEEDLRSNPVRLTIRK